MPFILSLNIIILGNIPTETSSVHKTEIKLWLKIHGKWTIHLAQWRNDSTCPKKGRCLHVALLYLNILNMKNNITSSTSEYQYKRIVCI